MSDRLAAVLEEERVKLRKLWEGHAALVESVRATAPDQVQLSALAALLHSFYGGVENCMRAIATFLDGGLPKSESWHINLLQSMNRAGPTRPPLLTDDLVVRLREYLGFRHVFRGHYAFELDWDKMRPLVENLPAIAGSVDVALQRFVTFLAPPKS